MEDDEYFYKNRKISENVHTRIKGPTAIKEGSEEIDDSDDDNKYGLDYLEEYQRNGGSIYDGPTAALTNDNELVTSPVSRISTKKKVSVKTVTRRNSFNSSKLIQVRTFAISELKDPNYK